MPRILLNSALLLSTVAICLPMDAAPVASGTTPPGFNVHLVEEREGHRFWRGGAPTPATLKRLDADAEKRGVTVTLVDLRTPANTDDRSGKGGRLSPADEAATAQRLGIRYLPINALSKELPEKLRQARKSGDIYIHCMYGVNRTGFAVARYATAEGINPDRKGLGKRDWAQGAAFQSGKKR